MKRVKVYKDIHCSQTQHIKMLTNFMGQTKLENKILVLFIRVNYKNSPWTMRLSRQ